MNCTQVRKFIFISMEALKKILGLLKSNWKTTLVGVFFFVFGVAYFFKLIDAQGLTMVWGALGGVGFTISKDA
jgi:hypothetical protein